MQYLYKFLCFSALILLFSTRVDALTLSPAIQELTIDPGASEEFVLRINSNQNTPAGDYFLFTQNFEARGETGIPFFTTTDQDLASWISVQSQVRIEPNQSLEIPFTISVPEDTNPGGYFATLFISNQAPATSDTLDSNSQVTIGSRVGSLILLRVSGDIEEKGGIIEFRTENGKKFHKTLPIDFTYRFNNDGADRVSPQGTVTFTNLLGFKVDTVEVNTQRSNVLPGSVRKFNFLWGEERELENTNPIPRFFEKVSYQLSDFKFGYYKATLDLSWGIDNDQSESATTSVIVLPVELTILLVILLFALIVFVKLYNRWIVGNAIKALQAQNPTPTPVKVKEAPVQKAKKSKSTKKASAKTTSKAKTVKSSKTETKKTTPKKSSTAKTKANPKTKKKPPSKD